MLAQMWMPTGDELSRIAPLFSLVATLVAILLGALAVGRSARVSAGIVTIGTLVTGILAFRGLTEFSGPWQGFDGSGSGNSPMLVADAFSYFFMLGLSIFMLVITGMWWLGQQSSLPEREVPRQDPVEFFILFVGSAFGMALMVSTTNLLMIILAIEMASLPSYGITAFRKQNSLAAEASLKYVLFGAITSAIMIYGASLLYGYFGTLDVATLSGGIAQAYSESSGGSTVFVSTALFAFIVGIGFKVSAVPFHFWCPDVFQGASIEVTTWLSVASKAAGLGLLLRMITVLVNGTSFVTPQTLDYMAQAIAVMAAVTCTVGNLSAFRQTNLKRLLAFSSIAHAGYMLMAAAILWRPAAGIEATTHPAFSAILSYIIIYMLMNIAAFGIVAMVYWATGSENIEEMSGMIRRNKLIALCMIVILFSLVGLPPFGGFIAKYFLLFAVWEGGLQWLVIVAVLNTLISLYYYARVARTMVFTDSGKPDLHVPLAGQAMVVACTLLVLLTGTFLAGNLKSISDRGAKNLYAVAPVSKSVQTADASGPQAALPAAPEDGDDDSVADTK